VTPGIAPLPARRTQDARYQNALLFSGRQRAAEIRFADLLTAIRCPLLGHSPVTQSGKKAVLR